MTESEKQRSNFTVNKLLIDFLEDDGVICNALNKEYDEHRLLMETILGRKLEFNEVVHHINGDKTDNRVENLQVLTRAEHLKAHKSKKK